MNKVLSILTSIRFSAQRHLVNAIGPKTDRKIVVIESDDWGAIRMPNAQIYNQLLELGLINPNDKFARYDGLESADDLNALFNVLDDFTDINNNPAVITANVIVCNPDFEQIEASNYQTYHYETVEKTFERERTGGELPLWKEGFKNKLFHPQLHGREHVNVDLWMQKLKAGNQAYRKAFKLRTYAIDGAIAAAFHARSVEEEKTYSVIIGEAVEIFQSLMGYPSVSFIAPNYTWNEQLESILHKFHLKTLQGSKRQNFPIAHKKGNIQKVYHYSGQKNKFGQIYFVRNCLFEPALSPNVDYVSACLRHIATAFRWKKPAIIGSHRLNYLSIGGERYRDQNLNRLRLLLSTIQKCWPDVEFTTTAGLAEIFPNN